jgi:hypothetical protein
MKRKIKLALTLVCFFAFQTLTMASINVTRGGDHSVTFTNYWNYYYIQAFTVWWARITSAAHSSGTGGTWFMLYSEPSTGTPCRVVTIVCTRASGGDSTELFSVTFSGTVRGGSTGSGITRFNITGTFEETLAITPGELIVPLDKAANFTLYNTGYRCGSYWQIPPSTSWISSHPYYSAPTDVAGIFKVVAAAHDDGGDALSGDDAADLTVVKIVSVKVGTAPNEIVSTVAATEPGPGPDQTYYVPKLPDTNVTVTATPYPDVWPENYPLWSPGTTPSQNGSPTYNHSTATAGTTKIIASCGNNKALNVVVVEVAKIVASSSSASKDIESTKDYTALTNNERLLTVADEEVTITATPNPADVWPEGYPLWPSHLYWGIPVYVFTPTVGETTPGAHCGNNVGIKILAFAASISKSTYSDKLRVIYKLTPASVAGFGFEFSIGGVSKNGTVDSELNADTTPLTISSLIATVGTGSINFKLIDPVTGVKANLANQYTVREREIYKEGGTYSGTIPGDSGSGGGSFTPFTFMIKAKSKYRNILFFSNLSTPILSSYWATSFSKELLPSDSWTSDRILAGTLDLSQEVSVSQTFTPGEANAGYIMNSGPLDSVFTITYYFWELQNTGTVRLELDDDKPEMQGVIPQQ